MSTLLDDIAARVAQLDPATVKELIKTARDATRDFPNWIMNPGPQTEAFYSEADELFYGGEAGGGKSDLLLGTALNAHRKALILRRLNPEVDGLIERMATILGHTAGLKRSPPAHWRFRERLIKFGGCQNPNDWEKYQGDPKDFLGLDEITHFLEGQYRALIPWNRSVAKGQRSRVIVTGNPPMTPDGMWVLRYWAPWLDLNHPNPAADGELRWFTTIEGKDVMVEGPGPITLADGSIHCDRMGVPILPKSRTFIRATLADNQDLEETGYRDRLHALSPELKSAMAEGDFTAGLKDSEHQTIPREWLEMAFMRWNESGRNGPMTALAGDLAEARDRSVLCPRHGGWFDKMHVKPGRETPDGPTTAAWITAVMRNGCEIVIDMGGGYGASTRDHLRQLQIEPTLYNGSNSAEGLRDRTGIHKFRNIRAAAIWRFRDALDPTYGSNLAIFPDYEMLEEAVAHKHINGLSGMQIMEKADVKKLLGRSPDKFDAIVMAHFVSGKTNHTRVGIGRLQTHAITSGRNPRRR